MEICEVTKFRDQDVTYIYVAWIHLARRGLPFPGSDDGFTRWGKYWTRKTLQSTLTVSQWRLKYDIT